MREYGFYWVKGPIVDCFLPKPGSWGVAYHSDDGIWYGGGDDNYCYTDELVALGPRLEPPKE